MMSRNYFTLGAISSVLALLILSATLISMVYIFIVEKPELRYMNLPFPVLKNPIYPGDALPLRITRCSDAKGRRIITSSRYLDNLDDDEEVLVLDVIAAIIPPGCVTQIVNIHHVPESTLPGDYRLLGSTTVPGMIRDFQIEWYSEPFHVIARPSAIQPLKTPP